MRKLYKIFSVLLLAFNMLGAFYGGTSLILYPDGSDIQLDLNFLEHSPFKNYLIPGIILFCVNGLFSAFVLWQVVMNKRHAAKLIIVQGILLTGWILIQIMLIRSVFGLHFIMGGTGLSLIAFGCLQYNGVKKIKVTKHKT